MGAAGRADAGVVHPPASAGQRRTPAAGGGARGSGGHGHGASRGGQGRVRDGVASGEGAAAVSSSGLPLRRAQALQQGSPARGHGAPCADPAAGLPAIAGVGARSRPAAAWASRAAAATPPPPAPAPSGAQGLPRRPGGPKAAATKFVLKVPTHCRCDVCGDKVRAAVNDLALRCEGIVSLDQSALATKGKLVVVATADPERLRRRLRNATGKSVDLVFPKPAMAPPPPDLIDDATGEILLRLPPDDPACLLRASLVCKAWRKLLSSPAFLRRYRAFHGAPPLLGFLHNTFVDDGRPCARFVAASAFTSSPFSAPAFDRSDLWFVDCRHGRALLKTFGGRHALPGLVVWDPITGDQQYLTVPCYGYPTYYCCTAAVLCAADGCDHLDCHGGPFRVVAICASCEDYRTRPRVYSSWACVYSSQTGAWTTPSFIDLDANYIEERPRPSLLAGDALYFSAYQGQSIVKYSFIGHSLHVIDAPDKFEPAEGIVVAAEGGGLGLAGVKDGINLHLWSWQAGPGGIEEWVQGRVIKLRTLFPILNPRASPDVIGFQEGTDTIFISIDMDVFAVSLRSEQVKKVGRTGSRDAMAPYVSFYTPDLAKGRLLSL